MGLLFLTWLWDEGFLQIQHGGFLVMLFFSACANTPEVRFVENKDNEEQIIFLDLSLPQEAQYYSYFKFN